MRKVFNNKVLLFIVAVLLLANIALVFYFVGMKERGKRMGNDHQRPNISVFLKKDIGFNDQQMAAFDKLRQQHRQKMRAGFEDIRQAKVKFYDLLSNPVVNDTALHQAASGIAEKQKALELMTFQNFREIRALSTPSQLPMYDSLVPGLIEKMWFQLPRDNAHDKRDSLKTH
jgi:protein CpxP